MKQTFRYRFVLPLGTPYGNTTVETFVDVEFQNDPEDNDPESVTVTTDFLGKKYTGYGKDFMWADAFADLQRNLPENIKIKCCLSCRHVNMCPTGNVPNELFCTRDLEIRQKSDLFFCTEHSGERKKRLRPYTFVCGDYQPQNRQFYIYNDYFSF